MMQISSASSTPASSLPLPERLAMAPGPVAPTDGFTPSEKAMPEPAAAKASATAPAAPAAFDHLLAPSLPEPFRAPITAALAALPPGVTRALGEHGFQLQVVQAGPDAPLPFHFEPYNVDRLREATASIASMSPKDHKSLSFLGARVVSERCDPYFTFPDLARQRGATTREEVEEMAELARGLNPELALPNGDLPPGQHLFIPDYYYWKGQRVPTAAWNALTQEEQGIAGTTFDKGIPGTDAPTKFILMSATAFKDTPELATFYLHHEIGHAVVDVLTSRDPSYARSFLGEMGERMEADRKAKVLLRPYSGSEPDEFVADAFASRFLAPPAAKSTPEEIRQASLCGETLRQNDVRAYELSGQMLEHLEPGRP